MPGKCLGQQMWTSADSQTRDTARGSVGIRSAPAMYVNGDRVGVNLFVRVVNAITTRLCSNRSDASSRCNGSDLKANEARGSRQIPYLRGVTRTFAWNRCLACSRTPVRLRRYRAVPDAAGDAVSAVLNTLGERTISRLGVIGA